MSTATADHSGSTVLSPATGAEAPKSATPTAPLSAASLLQRKCDMPSERAEFVRDGIAFLKAKIVEYEAMLEATVAHAAEEDIKYKSEIEERNRLRAAVEEVERRIGAVHQVIARYAAVEDPVIASDGYSYERRVILGYIEDCQKSGVAPRSNQIDTELTNDLYSNSTLRRIVEQLGAVRLPNQGGAVPAAPAPAARAAPGAAGVAAANSAAAMQQRSQVAPPMQHAAHHQHHYAGGSQQQQAPPPPPPPPPQFGSSDTPTFTVTNTTPMRPLSGLTHPCMRVYGSCNFGDSCTWARYPIECCLSHLKGRCRYGHMCHELHVIVGAPGQQPAAQSSQQAASAPQQQQQSGQQQQANNNAWQNWTPANNSSLPGGYQLF